MKNYPLISHIKKDLNKKKKIKAINQSPDLLFKECQKICFSLIKHYPTFDKKLSFIILKKNESTKKSCKIDNPKTKKPLSEKEEDLFPEIFQQGVFIITQLENEDYICLDEISDYKSLEEFKQFKNEGMKIWKH